ncbi:endonuclease/exonuclease/phosphatase family protein [Maribacter sp. 2308TA10-17]|uniref:endonuclease/exonuclease/phosphatase family protein n=1 Tax=Maribacter sp. 2308TA10-17 TaxID=3386276 RepID=UPI0039BC339D
MSTLNILSWNVEHFNGKGGMDKRNRKARLDRVERVANFIASESPDIFALSEVEGKIVHAKMTSILPNYVFNITEGRQSQQILVGVKHGLTAFFTQRNEFKRSNPYLRPSALLTITIDGKNIPILFSHLKSLLSPEGFGLRDAMFSKVFSLKRALDKVARRNGNEFANFIVLGDMNTMGMDYEGKDKDISSAFEVEIVTNRFRRRGMVRLEKNHPTTFNNGSDSSYPQTDLDHVFAAKHLQFKPVSGNGFVDVGGWAKFDDVVQQDKWIEDFSDHTPIKLTLEI